jgi:pimeloyl-ACP methyl ester carboxylesterase
VPYLDIAGQRVWHAVAGEGEPVVLLHGGFAGASSWGANTPAIVAAGFQVYTPERRGHVHTPDIPGPITYSNMADDTIAYLDAVVKPAHLVGWSDGAVVGLLVAQRRPDLVKRLVLIGQYYNSGGKAQGAVVDELLDLGSETTQFVRAEFDEFSPDGPDYFPTYHAKMMHLFNTEPELELASFSGVQAETLVLQGDRDEVTLEHSKELAETMPNARLAVLPGSHGLPIESPDTFNPLVIFFLKNGVPESIF